MPPPDQHNPDSRLTQPLAFRPGSQPPAAAPADPRLPERLGRYVIVEEIGTGGFARVFLAKDEELGREVAIKVPRRDRFRNAESLQKFGDEARTAARLRHPGIVAVFDVGTQDDIPFIVLEYIRGRTLFHLLQHEKLSWPSAAQMVAEIADALGHAHEQGFVHRDIKPQNILLDMEDRPHIADFGLAIRHREMIQDSRDVAGTTRFMAPEQVRAENHRIDARTDIWALGVVMYDMLTGHLPFEGSSPTEVIQQILYKDPVPPRQIDHLVPAELERICLRCLCRQMSERYRTAADLVDDVSEWLRFSGGGSGVSSSRRRPVVVGPPDAMVVPRGLRSYEQEDADFFLKLIPGPRDRDGLPVVLRFWKKHIEEREADRTFRVGVLYDCCRV
jgi:serine/threonine protein kinase